MLTLSMLTQAALAWNFAADPTVTLPETPEAAAIVRRADGNHLALSGPDATRLVVPSTGAALSSVSFGATAILASDRDGDGLEDLVLCGADGIAWVPWASGGLGNAVPIDADPCADLAAADPFALVTASPLEIREDDGAGGFDAAVDLGAPAMTAPRVAADGLDIAAFDAGGTTLYLHDAYGLSSLAAGGIITGLAPGPGGFWFARADGKLRRVGGPTVDLSGTPGRIWSADIDLDGQLDAVVLYPEDGKLGLLQGGGAEVLIDVPLDAHLAAIGQLDTTLCPEIVVFDPGNPGLTVVRMLDCQGSTETDSDGDGYPAGEDCDDGDATTYPGAPEGCDGADNDCDGQIDEGGALGVSAPAFVEEGDRIEVNAAGVCSGRLELDLDSGGAALADCDRIDDATLACDILDDGAISFTARAYDEGGQLTGAVTESVDIDNVPPSLFYGGYDYPISLVQGEFLSWQIVATDPGDDTITFRSEGGFSGWDLTSAGFASISGDTPGDYVVTVIVEDEDGGASAVDLQIEVIRDGWPDSAWDDDTGGVATSDLDCCCCGAGAGMAALAMFALLGRRAFLPV